MKPALKDDWRSDPGPIPEGAKRQQLVYEAVRAIIELHGLEAEIQRANPSGDDLDTP